jgi:glycosyltransferase involved in cell wall biosynthesis
VRILHATDTFGPTVGGIEVLVRDLAARQAAAGHDVTVLTRTPGPDADTPGVTVCRDPGRLGELARHTEVVHAHVSAYSPLALRTAEAAVEGGVPAVALVHSMWSSGWPIAHAVARARGWIGGPIQWAAVSEAAAAPVRRALPGGGVVVLPNAVDVVAWTPRTPWTARPRDAATGPFTVVSVMRMTRRKRPFAVVEALRRLTEELGPEVPLRAVLVGDGPLRAAVARAVVRHGLDGWVSVPGALGHDEIKELYAAADVFVAPATLESFGIAALEARAAGLAVVARAGTGVGDFVQHGQDGLLAGNDDELTAALFRLCTEPALLGAIRQHNATHPPSFDWADVLWRNAYAYELAAGKVGLAVAGGPTHVSLTDWRPESVA